MRRLAGEHGHDALHARRSRAFHQQGDGSVELRRECDRKVLVVIKALAAIAKCADRFTSEPADCKQAFDANTFIHAATTTMPLRGPTAQPAHVAKHPPSAAPHPPPQFQTTP